MPELIKYKTFLTYLFAKMRKTSLWSIADRIIKYSRRFLFIGRIFKYISIAFAIIETSAVLILSAALLALVIPILFVAIVSFYIADLIIGRRIMSDANLRGALKRDKILIFSGAGSFGESFAEELSKNGAAVFIITASPSRRFISAKYENGVFYVRHAFFFRLKRRMFKGLGDKLIYLL